MAAGSAAERAETGGIQKARFRGREVVLTFSMQASFGLSSVFAMSSFAGPFCSVAVHLTVSVHCDNREGILLVRKLACIISTRKG